MIPDRPEQTNSTETYHSGQTPNSQAQASLSIHLPAAQSPAESAQMQITQLRQLLQLSPVPESPLLKVVRQLTEYSSEEQLAKLEEPLIRSMLKCMTNIVQVELLLQVIQLLSLLITANQQCRQIVWKEELSLLLQLLRNPDERVACKAASVLSSLTKGVQKCEIRSRMILSGLSNAALSSSNQLTVMKIGWEAIKAHGTTVPDPLGISQNELKLYCKHIRGIVSGQKVLVHRMSIILADQNTFKEDDLLLTVLEELYVTQQNTIEYVIQKVEPHIDQNLEHILTSDSYKVREVAIILYLCILHRSKRGVMALMALRTFLQMDETKQGISAMVSELNMVNGMALLKRASKHPSPSVAREARNILVNLCRDC